MSAAGTVTGVGLVHRVRGVLLKPGAEWSAIEAEPASLQSLYLGYAGVLAAVPSLAFVTGHLMWRYNPLGAVLGALIAYGLFLGLAYVAALIVSALAPGFQADKDRLAAQKLVIYSLTPYWLGGIFFIYWPLMPLVPLCGLYSLFLIYLGAPKLMRPARDRSLLFTIVVMVVVVLAASFGETVLWNGWGA